MLQLVSKDISSKTQKRLTYLQNKVNKEASFSEKAEKAKKLWNSKSGSNVGKAAFREIKDTLEEMCVYVDVCNYCEHNEANDIEHIAPKSFYPELAFVWENYLLACKQCNTALKLDKYYVLDKNDDVHQLVRKQPPPFEIHAFINPREEDPNEFMILNLETFTYFVRPNLSKKDRHKASKTIEILELNKRDTLKVARQNCAIYYYSRLNTLTKILRTNSKTELHNLLTPYDDSIDDNLTLAQNKQKYILSFKNHIQTYQHPSVWYAIKLVSSKFDPKWKRLFDAFPEALNW